MLNSNIFNMLQGALQNPAPFLARMGMPNALQNPQQAVQELLNSGRMSQQQFEQLRQMSIQFQNQFNLK